VVKRKEARQTITGTYAKRAVAKAGALNAEIQRDVVSVALVAGQDDPEGLEKLLRGVMRKSQAIDALHTAALFTGRYEGLGVGLDDEEAEKDVHPDKQPSSD